MSEVTGVADINTAAAVPGTCGVGAWIRYGWPISAEQIDFAAEHYRAAILQPCELEAAA